MTAVSRHSEAATGCRIVPNSGRPVMSSTSTPIAVSARIHARCCVSPPPRIMATHRSIIATLMQSCPCPQRGLRATFVPAADIRERVNYEIREAFARIAVGELALIQDNSPATVPIERSILQVPPDAGDQLFGRVGNRRGALPRDVGVVGELVV